VSLEESGAPFAALLVGQPTLRHRLRLGVLAALDQRISVRYALTGMTPKEALLIYLWVYLRDHLGRVGR
jgi:type II secretory pathway predicted ATPase ExeA